MQDYLYFDPRTIQRCGTARRQTGPFNDAVVFIVGGGGIMEYGYLQEWAVRQQGRRAIYGMDELLSPVEFIFELDKLGS